MPNHLSLLGIIHTAISILALFAAFYTLAFNGNISPAKTSGKLYIWLTVITCLTGLPIMKTGHPTPGHFLAIIILVLLPLGIYAKKIKLFGEVGEYIQVFIMSLTLFFSCIPAVVETLTRLPISHPIANGPNAPVLQMGLGILLIAFIAGTIYQLIRLRSRKKSVQTPDSSINLS